LYNENLVNMRLDIYLVENSICTSRDKSKELILKGYVSVNGKVVTKPSYSLNLNDIVDYDSIGIIPYVSRGGLKLERAIKTFNLDFIKRNVLDVGASTGGFTDCALKHGASFVWAVDVGSGQLDESLRHDSRVCSMEKTDFRSLKSNMFDKKIDIIVADLSFISLKFFFDNIPQNLIPQEFALLLIKPQFEAGPHKIGKGGIVKDKKTHIEIISSIADYSTSAGLYLNRLTWSPIVDTKKNIEYLALFEDSKSGYVDIKAIVDSAFKQK